MLHLSAFSSFWLWNWKHPNYSTKLSYLFTADNSLSISQQCLGFAKLFAAEHLSLNSLSLSLSSDLISGVGRKCLARWAAAKLLRAKWNSHYPVSSPTRCILVPAEVFVDLWKPLKFICDVCLSSLCNSIRSGRI